MKSPARLTVGVLREVSRSFYLTIRMLPAAMREPVGVAYLLARASDTLADAPGIPAARRVEVLDRMSEAIRAEASPAIAFEDEEWTAHRGEQALLRRLPECFERYRALEEPDRVAVAEALGHIVRGQREDVLRFSEAGKVVALPDAAALERYTYLVAGCVGEFWTGIGFRHARKYSAATPSEMMQLGVDFGKGLQLVNVLRDLPADLENGRSYLPADEGSPRAAFPKWLKRARVLLGFGADYVERVRPWRLRLAVFLPWYLGEKTLALLERNPPLETGVRVKVSRAEVRRGLWLGLRCAVSNAALREIRRRLPQSPH